MIIALVSAGSPEKLSIIFSTILEIAAEHLRSLYRQAI